MCAIILFSARLPFKVMETKPVIQNATGCVRNKKRKSETILVHTKAAKSAKSDDLVVYEKMVDPAENEVSSSSEPDSSKSREHQKQPSTLLDKFVRSTQQPEVLFNHLVTDSMSKLKFCKLLNLFLNKEIHVDEMRLMGFRVLLCMMMFF